MELQEVWKDIQGYEGKYEVSNKGNVKSINYLNTGVNKNLKLNRTRRGYTYVRLCKNGAAKYCLVHRLVGFHFLENEHNYPQINHIDGIRDNNHVSNLEWCTAKQNQQHAISTGLRVCTEETRKKMSEARKGGKSYNYGREFSKETRRKLSESHKGIFDGGNNPMYGRKHSQETKLKISEKNKNMTEETRRKIGDANRGLRSTKCTKVECVTTGEKFDFILQASEKYKINRESISACCRGKQKSAGKHKITGEKLVWKYLKDSK